MSVLAYAGPDLRRWVAGHRWLRWQAVNTVRNGVHRQSLQLAEGRLRTSGPCSVRGAERVRAGQLLLGAPLEFTAPGTWSALHVEGELVASGWVQLAAGVEVWVADGGRLTIGDGTFINAHSLIFCNATIDIGAGCAISWRVQLLDTDRHGFHHGPPQGATAEARPAGIRIGDRVWIGAGATILPGAVIAPGCVVAAGAVVRGVFDEPGCLLAGVPARVVRRNVRWTVDPGDPDPSLAAEPAAPGVGVPAAVIEATPSGPTVR